MSASKNSNSEKWLVIGSANGSGNLGDEAMWQAAVQQLRMTVGDVEVVTDSQPDWDFGGLPRVTTMPYLYFSLARWGRLQFSRSRLVRLAAKIVARPARMKYALRAYEAARDAPQDALQREWRSLIGEASGVLFSGAGAMTGRYAVNGILTWALITEWAKKQDVPVCFLGQGVGPFGDAELERIARRALEMSDVVGVREARSFDVLREWGLGAKTTLAADWATLDVPNDADRGKAAELHSELVGGKPFISICLHRVRGLSKSSISALVESTRTVLEFASANSLAVVFVPNMLGGGVNDDRSTADFVLRELGVSEADDLASVRGVLSAAQTRALHARAEFTVSTRYHTLVFAGAEGKHTVGLAIDDYWRQKLEGTQLNAQQTPRVASVSGVDNTQELSELREMLKASLVESTQPLPGIRGDSAAQTLLDFLNTVRPAGADAL